VWIARFGKAPSGRTCARYAPSVPVVSQQSERELHVGGERKARTAPEVDWDTFEGATGYQRIAVDAIRAFRSAEPKRLVLNIPNLGAIRDLQPEDVIEIPCMVNRSGPQAVDVAGLTFAVRSLVMAVKHYERLTIDAALRRDRATADFALFSNPIVADREFAPQCSDRLLTGDLNYA